MFTDCLGYLFTLSPLTVSSDSSSTIPTHTPLLLIPPPLRAHVTSYRLSAFILVAEQEMSSHACASTQEDLLHTHTAHDEVGEMHFSLWVRWEQDGEQRRFRCSTAAITWWMQQRATPFFTTLHSLSSATTASHHPLMLSQASL